MEPANTKMNVYTPMPSGDMNVPSNIPKRAINSAMLKPKLFIAEYDPLNSGGVILYFFSCITGENIISPIAAKIIAKTKRENEFK